jgi:hypothetical protein
MFLAHSPTLSVTASWTFAPDGSAALAPRGTIYSVLATCDCHYILWLDRLMQQSQVERGYLVRVDERGLAIFGFGP